MRTANVLHSFSPSVQFALRWISTGFMTMYTIWNTTPRICQTVSSRSLWFGVVIIVDLLFSLHFIFLDVFLIFGRLLHWEKKAKNKYKNVWEPTKSECNMRMHVGTHQNRSNVCGFRRFRTFVPLQFLDRKWWQKKNAPNSFVTILKYHFVSRGFIWTNAIALS